MIQITLLSRLRSLFTKYPRIELLSRIEKAAKNCKVGDAWEGQPSWWTSGGDSPTYYDALLLESLVEFGFGLLGPDKKFADTAKGKMNVTLTNEWKQYEFDLSGKDLSLIKTGFYWTVAGQGKPVTFFLDKISFE